ncbi:TPA: hypothetical protein TT917_001470 [Streptococcus equi subsp. zooepidemicus]|uniref:Uncharacterized protein n=1 Tax=Streptococcus equi subsp. zooepidemicus TaxID=40041 RepID=A0A7Z8ZT73_STRSZ|nr:hypothetical protein [Streptococcus equi subsp. zooepidemicus]VEF04870.1 Uncharacterised protein [Streptococcus equi subsp. zooepidemicus]HEL0020792.1 hypothetical protein [Streptococcus equi subsp. zooepidemicus]HEL0022645.1 hypothetical protein [Streptococcus equi subsp. zooepidemicus]HEL0040575.1 hypothetical protein [Streptococcus equi subsp. zooepidemicus]
MTDWQNGNGWIESFEDQQEKIQSNRKPKKVGKRNSILFLGIMPSQNLI